MREVYLDNSATTATDPEVAQAAVRLMERLYGNPSSLHTKGYQAHQALSEARAGVAAALGCDPQELVFTSGGTEANNLALQGAVAAHKRRGRTVVCMAFEHASVLEPLRFLAGRGDITLKLIDPRPDGTVDADRLVDAVDDDTILLSCMLVNSEVGTIAPIADIAKRAKRKQPRLLLHCDAVQAFGKHAFAPAKLGADLLSISGHKIHAPKGVGALYVRKGVRILPLMHGGHQERELRPGTEPTPLIAALAAAAEKAVRERADNHSKVARLHEYFVNKAAEMPEICINSPADATPYICNLSVPGWRSEILLHHLAERGVYVSSGSACAGGAKSHVLTAMGLPDARVDSALRVSFCAGNTPEDADAFFEVLADAMQRRKRST